VVDGLGHGHEASTAAHTAAATLEADAGEPVVSLVTRCHEALKGTRGVAMSLANFDALDSSMSWVAVGNVDGLLLRVECPPGTGSAQGRGKVREALFLRGGVMGYQLPSLRPGVVPVHRGDVLVLATDGIGSGHTEVLALHDRP
jgi:hypothetical protein